MIETVCSSIIMVLSAAVLIALGIALYSFFFMVVCWKTPKRRGHIIRLLVSLAVIPCLIGIHLAIFLLVLVPALGRQQMAEHNAAQSRRLIENSLVHVGDIAPEFSLLTVDGDEFCVPYNGKVVMVVFFATWCGPCQMELPYIEQIWKAKQKDGEFRLLVIGREETEDSVRQYRDKNGFSFPIAADPDRAVYSLYAKGLIPRTVVVSPDGRIVYSNAGFLEDDLEELNRVLDEQLAQVRQNVAVNSRHTKR